MNQTAGIIIEKNALGIPSYAHIDIKKYGNQLKDFFLLNGVEINDIPNNQTKKAMLEARTKNLKTYENAEALLEDLYR